MSEFEVTITETLAMTVTVEAESAEQARQMVKDQWRNCEYILDAEHFKGVNFTARKPKRNRDYER